MVNKKFRNINEIIHIILKNYNLEYSVKKENLFENWKNIIGDKLYDKCKPVRMEDKTLILKAKNSVWRNELKLLQKDILQIIEQKTGKNYITKIRFI